MIALLGGEKLSEHENYGEATVHMLHGRVRLGAGENRWDGSPGGLIVVPDGRHDLEPWRTPSCCSRGEAPVTVVVPEVHHEHPARWAQDTALVPLPRQRVDDDPAIDRPVQCGAFDCPWSYVASQRAELIPDPASARAGESSPRTPAPGRATGVR